MLYLLSEEYENLRGPYECTISENVHVNNRQVLVVKINHSLSGIDYWIELKEIAFLLLLAKYSDSAIKKLDHFPIDVVVFIPENLDAPLEDLKSWDQMKSIGWATLTNEIHMQV